MDYKLKKVSPNSLAVLDKYNLLNFDATPTESIKATYEVYKDAKKVEEVAKAVFQEKSLVGVNFGEFDNKILAEGVQSFFAQLSPVMKK